MFQVHSVCCLAHWQQFTDIFFILVKQNDSA